MALVVQCSLLTSEILMLFVLLGRLVTCVSVLYTGLKYVISILMNVGGNRNVVVRIYVHFS